MAAKHDNLVISGEVLHQQITSLVQPLAELNLKIVHLQEPLSALRNVEAKLMKNMAERKGAFFARLQDRMDIKKLDKLFEKRDSMEQELQELKAQAAEIEKNIAQPLANLERRMEQNQVALAEIRTALQTSLSAHETNPSVRDLAKSLSVLAKDNVVFADREELEPGMPDPDENRPTPSPG